MIKIIGAIASVMGNALRIFYDLTLNYGIAIILFTLLIKLILVPLNIKQQKSMKETQEIQPLLSNIQKKYKDNPQKQQEELSRLYKEKKINPLGGCLLILVQFPIILAMFYTIAQPITYMFPEEAKKAEVIEDMEKYAGGGNQTYKEVYYMSNERKDLVNTQFLGLDLAQVPSSDKKNLVLWIIPILSGFTTFLTSKVSMKQTEKAGSNEQALKMQKNMMIIFPIMTMYISFIVPLGMGLYWLINNIISVIIQIIITKMLYKEEKINII